MDPRHDSWWKRPPAAAGCSRLAVRGTLFSHQAIREFCGGLRGGGGLPALFLVNAEPYSRKTPVSTGHLVRLCVLLRYVSIALWEGTARLCKRTRAGPAPAGPGALLKLDRVNTSMTAERAAREAPLNLITALIRI